MGKFKTLKLSGSKSSKKIESLDELDVNPSSTKSSISKSQSVSEGLSQRAENNEPKEKKENAGEISKQPKPDEPSTNDEDSSSSKRSRGATVLNGLARRATVMRQKSLDNIIQASKRLSMMPPKQKPTPQEQPQPIQKTILDLPNDLLTDILFRTVFWTTLEFDYATQLALMRTLSVVSKRFFETCTPVFWNRIWHAMTKTADREKATFDVGDAKSLKKECLKLTFYKTPYRKPSTYSGRHMGDPTLKITMCACDVGLGEFNLVMQLCRNTYIEVWDPRIEDVYSKAVKVDGFTNMLQMLVICHQEEFGSLRAQWVGQADGLVLVYGCDKRSSFEELESQWVKLAAETKKVDASLIPKILVCNKVDLPIEERQVTRAEGLAFAEKLNCPYIETSGKKRINIEELFEDIVREIRLARIKEYVSQVQESSEPLTDEPVDLP